MNNTYTNLLDKYSKMLNIIILLASLTMSILHTFFFDKIYDTSFYLIMLAPLLFMILAKITVNKYTKFIVPFVLIWIVDLFIYNNQFVINYLPTIISVISIILYITSMQNIQELYQTILPKISTGIYSSDRYKIFTLSILGNIPKSKSYIKIIKALVLSIPFLAIFLILFMSSDSQFSTFVNNLFDFYIDISTRDIIFMIMYFLLFLTLFLYGLSNGADRDGLENTKQYDPVIITTFMVLLNILFGLFIVFQMGYLFGGIDYLRSNNINPAIFAREGFFQLATVVSLVIIISLFTIKGSKDKKSSFMIALLMFQTVIIAISALKKMYLYQDIMGATILRYYVEWFEYFLIIVLCIAIFFVLFKKNYFTLINTIAVASLVSFSIVTSMNIDYMVASSHISQKSINNQDIDYAMLSCLSEDAKPAIPKNINDILWKYKPENCNIFMQK